MAEWTLQRIYTSRVVVVSCIDWLSIRHYVCCFAPNSILCTGLRNRGEKNWSHCCSNIGSRTPVKSTPTFCSGDRDGYPRGTYEFFHAWKICQVIQALPFKRERTRCIFPFLVFFFPPRFNIDVNTNSLLFELWRSPNANRWWKHIFIFHLAPSRVCPAKISNRIPNHIRALLPLTTIELNSIWIRIISSL